MARYTPSDIYSRRTMAALGAPRTYGGQADVGPPGAGLHAGWAVGNPTGGGLTWVAVEFNSPFQGSLLAVGMFTYAGLLAEIEQSVWPAVSPGLDIPMSISGACDPSTTLIADADIVTFSSGFDPLLPLAGRAAWIPNVGTNAVVGPFFVPPGNALAVWRTSANADIEAAILVHEIV